VRKQSPNDYITDFPQKKTITLQMRIEQNSVLNPCFGFALSFGSAQTRPGTHCTQTQTRLF